MSQTTVTLPEHPTIEQLIGLNQANGYHFFDRDTLRFFRSRICPEVYTGPDGWYFVTSEQFEDSRGNRGTRLYTVRKMSCDGSIDTVDEFQQYRSKESALRAIRRKLGQ